MYAEERQRAIAEQVVLERRVSVSRAAEQFGVTTETVRRDLAALEHQGLVRRVHGGAVPTDALTTIEPAVSDRHRLATQHKDRIARAAAALLPDGDGSILLDAGTTTGRLVRAIDPASRLTIVTNSPYIAVQLADHHTASVELLGGRVRRSSQAAVGPATVAALADIRVDVCFVGTNGLTLDHGFSTPDADEAAVKEAMTAAGRQVVVLSDSSKLGEQSLHRFARLKEIDVVVTDRDANPSVLAALEAHEIDVVVA